MNPIALGRRAPRTVLVRLALLVGVLAALALTFGGQPFSLGRSRPIASSGGQGYWLLAKDGGVFGYGDAGHHGTNLNSGNDAIGLVPTPTLRGYWIADDDGTVVAYGDARGYGSRLSNVDDIRGFAARPQGDGYWLVTRDGAAYAFGAAPYRGNTPALAANQKIVGIASTPSGNGYWLVGRDGGIFAFGDAAFHGSTGAIRLNQPIVGMARTASGNGYWFVASDGGVFAFGGAGFHGAAVGSAPAGGITGMAPTPSGNGYWLVGANGKVFPYGDAVNYGDGAGLSLRQPIVGITATPVVHTNSVPAPVADSASVAEDGSASINVMANDAGLGDGPIAIAIVSGPAHGTASVGGDKKINYVPSANYHGPDSITYKLTDADGESATAALSLTVTPVNDAPVASNSTLTTDEDLAAGSTLQASDIDGGSLSYSIVSPPAHGSVTVSGSNYTYTPDADYHGADSFTFRANDGSANSNTAKVSVTVKPVNDAPVVSNVSVSTDEDTPLTGAPVGSDVDGDELSFDLVDLPQHGTLTSHEDGSYTYTPADDWSGTDSLTYKATDGTLESGLATVTITVVAVDDPGAPIDGVLETDEDESIGGTLTATDVDASTFVVVSGPSHGTISGLDPATGAFTYTPEANYHGSDSFTFAADGDAENESPATITITVNSVEDAPVFVESGDGGDVEGYVDISATGTDVGNHNDDGSTTIPLPFPVEFYGQTYSEGVLVSPNGWLSFDGSDHGYTNYGLPVDSPAIFAWWDDLRTDGEGRGIFTQVSGSAPNRQFTIQWNVTRYGEEIGTASFQVVLTEGSPVVTLRYGDVHFPTSSDAGAGATIGVNGDSTNFRLFSHDTASLSDGLVLSFDTSTNSQTVGYSNNLATDEDTPVTGSFPATDGDGDELIYAIATPPAVEAGTAAIDDDGDVTFTPVENFNGSATFTVSVTDTKATVTKTVTVTVLPVNDDPTFDEDSDVSGSLLEEGTDGGDVNASDVDSNTLSFSIEDGDGPTNGSASVDPETGEWSYTGALDFAGEDSFIITVSDGDGGSADITVTVNVTNVNDAPVVSAIDNQTMDEDGTLEIPFTVVDPDTGDELSVTIGSSNPTLLPAGTLAVSETETGWSITVEPAANGYGTAHLFLMVSDGEAAPQLQDIVLTVNAVNDLPVANDGSLTTEEDTPEVGTLVGDDPVEHSPVTYSLVGEDGGAEHGTVTITDPATGAYKYTPDAEFNGSDSFSFEVSDGSGVSLPATISVTVNPVDDAPVFDGTGNNGTGDEENAINGTVLATDADDDAVLSYSIEEGHGAANGIASVDGETGDWSYTPGDDFAGTDSFTITVTDDDGLADTIVVSVTVGNLNDAPAFPADSVDAAGDEDTAIGGTVTAVDPDAGDTLAYSIEDGDGAAHGNASVNDTTGAWSYTGSQDFNGTDSFTVTVTDGEGLTDTIVVNLTVNPVNDVPTFDGTGITGSGNEDSVITGTVGATDVDGDALTYSILLSDGAIHGTATVNSLTGEWSYIGDPDYFGADDFGITISDGHGGVNGIAVNLTVANVNDAPVVSPIGNQSIGPDTTLVLPFTVTDADPDDVSFTITVGSSNPTLLPVDALTVAWSGTNWTLTVNPAPGLTGTAQVFVSVSDGHGAPVIQTFQLTVAAD